MHLSVLSVNGWGKFFIIKLLIFIDVLFQLVDYHIGCFWFNVLFFKISFELLHFYEFLITWNVLKSFYQLFFTRFFAILLDEKQMNKVLFGQLRLRAFRVYHAHKEIYLTLRDGDADQIEYHFNVLSQGLLGFTSNLQPLI
jgi:signal transduction histidine kinase